MGLNTHLGDLAEKAKSAVGLGVDKAVLYIQTAANENLGVQAVGHHVGNTLKQKGKAALRGELMGGGSGLLDTGNFYSLKVQFNPSSIRLNAHADGVMVRSHQVQQEDEILIQSVRPPSVVMTVDLIFDDSDPADCFAGTMLSPSLKAAFEVGTKVLGGTSRSVQPQTNALVGMLMQENTRVVCFQWADMAFVGEVNMVDANYTMFNTAGEPVRSKVSLSIHQKVEDGDAIGYWNDAFDKFFGKAGEKKHSSANNASNKVKGLVNLPFLK